MPAERPILLVGGAPRVPVDAIRHLTVAATGATALALAAQLREAGRQADLLLSLDAAPGAAAARYRDRDGLEEALAAQEAGVDYLELDLAVTKDNVLVVSHDPVLPKSICSCAKRLTRGSGAG